MKTKTMMVTLLLLSGIVFANGFKKEEELRTFSDTFMEGVIKDKFKESFDLAKPYWPLPTVEIDALVNQIKQQWPVVEQRFGKVMGKEFVKKEKIGTSFVRYYYLHKFTNHALYWRISFYKAKDEWKINSITYLDTLDNLYE